MAFEHTSKHKIEFSETDMAGIVHFSNFFKYMEIAERDLFEAVGLDPINLSREEATGWPRIHADCKFSTPLRFGDVVEIHLVVKAVKECSIDYQFRFFRIKRDGKRTQAASGSMTAVLVAVRPNEEIKSMKLPESILNHITPAPPELLNIADNDS